MKMKDVITGLQLIFWGGACGLLVSGMFFFSSQFFSPGVLNKKQAATKQVTNVNSYSDTGNIKQNNINDSSADHSKTANDESSVATTSVHADSTYIKAASKETLDVYEKCWREILGGEFEGFELESKEEINVGDHKTGREVYKIIGENTSGRVGTIILVKNENDNVIGVIIEHFTSPVSEAENIILASKALYSGFLQKIEPQLESKSQQIVEDLFARYEPFKNEKEYEQSKYCAFETGNYYFGIRHGIMSEHYLCELVVMTKGTEKIYQEAGLIK